jgi:hypothetical protein
VFQGNLYYAIHVTVQECNQRMEGCCSQQQTASWGCVGHALQEAVLLSLHSGKGSRHEGQLGYTWCWRVMAVVVGISGAGLDWMKLARQLVRQHSNVGQVGMLTILNAWALGRSGQTEFVDRNDRVANTSLVFT